MEQASLPVTQEIVGSNPIEVAWKMAWYANRQSGQAQTLVICGFDSRLRHWNTRDDWALASLTGRNPAIPQGFAGSTPARRTEHGPFVYRHRIPDPRSGEAGSIPARATR